MQIENNETMQSIKCTYKVHVGTKMLNQGKQLQQIAKVVLGTNLWKEHSCADVKPKPPLHRPR